MERSVVERIASDDALVAQPFFWSATGITLFGGSPDLRNEKKLTALLKAALQQQPAILGAFLQSEATLTPTLAQSSTPTPTPTLTLTLALTLALALPLTLPLPLPLPLTRRFGTPRLAYTGPLT